MKGESETNAWKAFRQHVLGPRDRGERMENLVGLGFPDTNCCVNGVEFWMEIKAGREPVRGSSMFLRNNHPLSQDQKNWFLKQRRAKGLGFVYIETDARRILLDGCRHGDAVNEMTVSELVNKSVWWAERPTAIEEWKTLWEFFAYHG